MSGFSGVCGIFFGNSPGGIRFDMSKTSVLLGDLDCVWGRTEGAREAGRDVEGVVGFKPPEKAIGKIGFGDLISGFGSA